MVQYYFDAGFPQLEKLVDQSHAVLITDENIFRSHKGKFKNWNTIVLSAGEEFKIQSTVDTIIEQLIGFEADRKTFLIGVGGGVITDLTGYTASIYMRGLKFGFVPTSVLAMVDASIGGKNGIDVGLYKNLVGIIRQPEFLLYDFSFLRSLPANEWTNGFAEIIKHAAIRNAGLFRELENNKIAYYKKDLKALQQLIRKNALIKSAVVQADEFENGERRLLNFGHTIGHAIENLYELSHGEAISIGMVAASLISEQFGGFRDTARLIALLSRYGLPTLADFDAGKVMEVLKLDKKKERNEIRYILLKKIGQGIVESIPVKELEKLIVAIMRAR